MTATARNGVSFVIPVHNGAATLSVVLDAVFAATSIDLPVEVIVVDDDSTDGSAEILRRVAASRPLQIVEGAGRGAAAAINTGILAARYPLIAQIDQDVVIDTEWLHRLVGELDDLGTAAAQGQYVVDHAAPLVERAMAIDLAQRYSAIRNKQTSHVCTGNSLYRAAALHQVGLFDESLGYGYDNDMSYRLIAAGYRLTFCRDAHSRHHWRNTLSGYVAQQYGFGYGRLDVVAKHPRRIAGDAVSPTAMMAHGVIMAAAMAALTGALAAGVIGRPWRGLALIATSLVFLLVLERCWASVSATVRFRDPAALLFVPLHLLRDFTWSAAIAVWSLRRIVRLPSHPVHSMGGAARRGVDRRLIWSDPPARVNKVLGIIPAYNEAANLAAVIAEVRRHQPSLDVLVIDDGSTDGSGDLLPSLGVRWLSFPERLGIGSAMRAGIRYAARGGYDACVRLDGDGQHSAADIETLLSPVRNGSADVVLGSRYVLSAASPSGTRVLQRFLATCLSLLTNSRVTDPTSGFYAFGPRALRLLAEHHPTGYPEPELRLFLSRNRLRTLEVPVAARPRLGGTTSLTGTRVLAATARVFLAMVIVPLRRQVGGRR